MINTAQGICNERDVRIQKEAAQQACKSGFGSGPYRPSLREMANKQLIESHEQAIKSQQLGELVMLLDKNPEVARILDLMEVVRR